jgi:hypothetical protein
MWRGISPAAAQYFYSGLTTFVLCYDHSHMPRATPEDWRVRSMVYGLQMPSMTIRNIEPTVSALMRID